MGRWTKSHLIPLVMFALFVFGVTLLWLGSRDVEVRPAIDGTVSPAEVPQ